ncbi:IS66 family insertion sequence element accessory protein TnpB [Prevotella melaninogenica]
MRQGILRLSQLVRSNDFNPSDGAVYVFFNRSRNRIKLLHWELLWFCRLSQTDGTGLLES